MPQAIPKGLTRDGVLRALADLDAGVEHPFGSPTGYELVHDGRRYPPKAVVGLACRSLLGRVLRPEEFSGGEAPGQADYILRELGFAVGRKGPESSSEEVDAEPAEGRAREWSHREVDMIVADYFAMLRAEPAGAEYSKAEHNRDLRPRLEGRSKGAVEFKHQNISAVLVEMGLPYIEGYKPARNYQRVLLPQAIEDYLAGHPELLDAQAGSPVLDPAAAPDVAGRPFETIFEEPPGEIIVPAAGEKPWLSRRGRRIDATRPDSCGGWPAAVVWTFGNPDREASTSGASIGVEFAGAMTMLDAQQTEDFKKALREIEDSLLGPPVTEFLKDSVSPPTWRAIAT